MTALHINPSQLSGHITIPSSKSQTLRALVFGLLAHGKSIIHSPLQSPDTEAMIRACELLGGIVEQYPNRIEIQGTGGHLQPIDRVLDVGNSGIVLRFIAAVSALSPATTILSGDHSICSNRPMQSLLEGLTQLGAHAISTNGNGFAPVAIRGPLHAGQATFDGSDSQPVSALLIAGAFASGPVQLHVRNPGETPWVSMTLNWLKRLSIPFEQEGFTHYRLQGNAHYSGFEYHVPGDISSAAFPLTAAVVTGSELTLHNIDLEDCQGDKQLIDVLRQMGATIESDMKEKMLHIKRRSRPLQGISIDINSFIDALPIVAVAACYADSPTHIKNGAIARHKECDRISCVAQELRKMGASIHEELDGLRITPSALKGATVETHHDHRLAMALSVAALAAKGKSTIHNIGCIAKTYPHFVEHFQRIGAKIIA